MKKIKDNEALHKSDMDGHDISVTSHCHEDDEEGNISALESLVYELDIVSNGFDPAYDADNEHYVQNRQRIEALKWAIKKLKK